MFKKTAALCAGVTAVTLVGATIGTAAADTTVHRIVAADKNSVVVAAAGDIACAPDSPHFRGGLGSGTLCRQMATAMTAERMSPDAVLALGDNQYERAELDNFRTSFMPSWGRFLNQNPKLNTLWPVAGNHELDFVTDSGYWPSFNGGTQEEPNATGVAGDTGKGWYSMQLGRWQVVALNSECGYSTSYLGAKGCRPGSPQYRWLRHQLADPAKCTLAMFHRPRFTIGEHEGERAVQPLWRLLAKAKTEVVLTGHNHNYERYAPLDSRGRPSPTGVRQFVVGTGGKMLYSWGGRGERLQPQAKSNTTVGVIRLRLKPTSYRWQFVRSDFAGNGNFSDSGRGTCRGPGAPLPAR